MALAPDQIGKLIRAEREKRGWSQQTLGERAGGLDKNTINRIELGGNTTLGSLDRVARTLEIEITVGAAPTRWVALESDHVKHYGTTDPLTVVRRGTDPFKDYPPGQTVNDEYEEAPIPRPSDVTSRDAYAVSCTLDELVPLAGSDDDLISCEMILDPAASVYSPGFGYVKTVDGRCKVGFFAQQDAGLLRVNFRNLRDAEFLAFDSIEWVHYAVYIRIHSRDRAVVVDEGSPSVIVEQLHGQGVLIDDRENPIGPYSYNLTIERVGRNGMFKARGKLFPRDRGGFVFSVIGAKTKLILIDGRELRIMVLDSDGNFVNRAQGFDPQSVDTPSTTPENTD